MREKSCSSENERRVQEKMKQLTSCNGDYGILDAQFLAKRMTWYKANKDKFVLGGSFVNQARHLLLMEYMGLDPVKDVPVVYEDPTKVTWRSFNFCPLLAACLRLGLDTREVCRQGAEKSVQALIAKLNPHLVFSRNYENLRPYGNYCEETIELKLI